MLDSKILRVLVTGFFLLGAGVAHAAEEWVRLGGADVAVWVQKAGAGTKLPVIIFSHGFHGCATQSRFLMEALANAGYMVFAPNHRDATCAGGEASWRDRAETPFGKPGSWTQGSFRDRGEDVRKLIEAIRRDTVYGPRTDLSRLGLAGHSLGGYTVLGLAGALPVWKIEGVKAVLALSPYSQPFVQHDTLAGLSAPVMYQGGTLDLGITPSVGKARGSYERSPQPKYFVEFEQASHFAWTDGGRNAHELIAAYGVAFLDHYVKGEPAIPLLTHAETGVAKLRYASELGNSGAGGNARK
jgi:predicted dienelactone hydrolase